jgi:hypothetical protein
MTLVCKNLPELATTPKSPTQDVYVNVLNMCILETASTAAARTADKIVRTCQNNSLSQKCTATAVTDVQVVA